LTDGDIIAMKKHALHRCDVCGAYAYIQVVEVPLSMMIQGASPQQIAEIARREEIPTPMYAYFAVKAGDEPRCPQCGCRITSPAERVIQFIPPPASAGGR
jgi:hypothetical protein